MQFEEEKLTEALLSEALPLLHEHFKEVYPQGQNMTVDFSSYVQFAEAGTYHVLTVRDASDKLCGYAGFYLRPHPHKSNSIEALNDVLYLAPEHRGVGLGKKFIIACDEMLKHHNVNYAMYSVPRDSGGLLALLDTQGYEAKEMVVGRNL